MKLTFADKICVGLCGMAMSAMVIIFGVSTHKSDKAFQQYMDACAKEVKSITDKWD